MRHLFLRLWSFCFGIEKRTVRRGVIRKKYSDGIVSSIENSDSGGIDDSGMAAVVMDGNEYVGYLTIPALELELL